MCLWILQKNAKPFGDKTKTWANGLTPTLVQAINFKKLVNTVSFKSNTKETNKIIHNSVAFFLKPNNIKRDTKHDPDIESSDDGIHVYSIVHLNMGVTNNDLGSDSERLLAHCKGIQTDSRNNSNLINENEYNILTHFKSYKMRKTLK